MGIGSHPKDLFSAKTYTVITHSQIAHARELLTYCSLPPKKLQCADMEGQEIQKKEQWPNSVHGLIQGVINDRETVKVGTGTLIAKNWVITAAHNLKPEYPVMKFCLSGKEIDVEKSFKDEDWRNTGDYALLKLSTEVHDAGHFGLHIFQELISVEKVFLQGYSQNDKWSLMGFRTGFKIDEKNMIISYTEAVTSPGMSGAGIYYQRGGKYFVIGVHTHGISETEKYCGGVLLTMNRFHKIREWICDDKTNTLLDSILPPREIELTGSLKFTDRVLSYEEINYLLECRFPNLLSLYLENTNISDEGALQIAKSELRNLRELYLSKNPVTSVGLCMVANSKTLKNLTKLILEGIKAFNDPHAIWMTRIVDWRKNKKGEDDLKLKLLFDVFTKTLESVKDPHPRFSVFGTCLYYGSLSEFPREMPEGKGIGIFKNGDIYLGEWKMNKMAKLIASFISGKFSLVEE